MGPFLCTYSRQKGVQEGSSAAWPELGKPLHFKMALHHLLGSVLR